MLVTQLAAAAEVQGARYESQHSEPANGQADASPKGTLRMADA